KLRQRRAGFEAAVAEKEVPPLVKPDAPAHTRVPAHAVPIRPVRMEKRPPDRFWPGLEENFDQLHPEDHAPGRKILRRQHLVLVIPAALIGLNYLPACRQPKIPCPSVR